MKLSTKSRYALRAIIELHAMSNGKPVFVREIAKRQDISERYLENIFTQLRANGVLISLKGKNGGFKLAKETKDITLLDIVTSVEGTLSIVECASNSGTCDRSAECVSREIWTEINKTLVDKIASYRLDKIIERHNEENDLNYYI